MDSPSAAWASAADGFIEERRTAKRIPGIGLAVAVNGREVRARGFGMRDVENGLPATPDTVFGIGSITKSFTCVAIMQLAEAGKLSVEDPVVRYLPEFRTPEPGHARAVTIHHFMTHTSGLPPLPSLLHALARSMEGDPAAEAPEEQALEPIDTYEELMDFIAETDFEILGAPGEHFSYSNDAYGLLGCIIERVSGLPYEDYVTARILRPFGMRRSLFDAAALASLEDVCTLYAWRPGQGGDGEVYRAPIWWFAPAMSAAGFLKSTPRDMLRYAEIFRTGGVSGDTRILSPESVRRMTHPHVEWMPGTAYGYGLGIHAGYHGVTLVEHNGGLKGIAANMAIVPERGITAVELANSPHVGGGWATQAVVNAALGLPFDARRVAFPDSHCPPARLADYEGLFVSGEGARIEATARDGRLELTADGKTLPGRPTGVDAFAIEVGDGEAYARFVRDGNGRVKAVAWGSRILPKVKGEGAANPRQAGGR